MSVVHQQPILLTIRDPPFNYADLSKMSNISVNSGNVLQKSGFGFIVSAVKMRNK